MSDKPILDDIENEFCKLTTSTAYHAYGSSPNGMDAQFALLKIAVRLLFYIARKM